MDCISYTNNHTPFTEKIPVPLQRLRIKEYGDRLSLKPKFEHNEITTFSHMPILFHLVENEPNSHLLLFSLFSLPEDPEKRERLIKLALDNGVIIHFSNEDIILKDIEGVESLEKIFRFTGDHQGNLF